MKRNVRRAEGAAALVVLVVACGSRVEAGLANAPAIERTSRPQRLHDVIADGHESCPPPGEPDPLAHRLMSCEERGGDAGRARAGPDVDLR